MVFIINFVKHIVDRKWKIGKKAVDMPTVVKIIFGILLLLALLVAGYALMNSMGKGQDQAVDVISFGG